MRLAGTRTALSMFVLFGLLDSASAAPLLTNGSFESGLTGWTVVDQAGGSGSWFSQTGTSSPLNSFTVPAPPAGTFAAMTDQTGMGSHVLYQDFLVPTGVTAADLSFDYFIGNQAGAFFTPNTLDYGVDQNQQSRVDIITTTADPFSVAAADVLFALLAPSANTLAYQTSATNLTAFLQAHQGETLRLRFAEVDNQNFFNMGIDAVDLNVVTPSEIPEPATLVLFGSGAILVLRRVRRSKA
jgi:PEP-CTERM motif